MTINEVLDFWFSENIRAKWFVSDQAFDKMLKERFSGLCSRALAGELDSWRDKPEGAVALVILLDQITRNIYRGTPEAFSGDAKAVEISRSVVTRDFNEGLDKDHRYVLYMPFMHSEDLAAQEEGVRLFTKLGNETALNYMKRHRDIIAQFGRFPHRNSILGRTSTPEEIEFLKKPGSSF